MVATQIRAPAARLRTARHVRARGRGTRCLGDRPAFGLLRKMLVSTHIMTRGGAFLSRSGDDLSPLHLLTREMYGAHNSYFGRASKIFSLPLKNFPESRLTLHRVAHISVNS